MQYHPHGRLNTQPTHRSLHQDLRTLSRQESLQVEIVSEETHPHSLLQ